MDMIWVWVSKTLVEILFPIAIVFGIVLCVVIYGLITSVYVKLVGKKLKED